MGNMSRIANNLIARTNIGHRMIHSSSNNSNINGNTQAGSRVVGLSKDEKCFVAYHPETEHPYEYTKPLPKKSANDSILKVDSRRMITKAPNLEQIQALTYTPNSYWHQFPGRAKREKYKDSYNDKDDRKGLTF